MKGHFVLEKKKPREDVAWKNLSEWISSSEYVKLALQSRLFLCIHYSETFSESLN